MNGRELSPNAEQRRRIMDFIMAAGQTLLENGAEVFRAEQTMEIMAHSFHLREFHVYVLTNGIFASAGAAETSEVRYVRARTVHLGRIAAVNELSREIASTDMTLSEAERRLAQVRQLPPPAPGKRLLASALGAMSFSLLFGGTLGAALVASAAGLAAGAYLLLCEKHHVPAGFRNISAAMLITFLCIAGCIPLRLSVSQAVIGAVMLLTPGISFTMSIRDFVDEDYLSGAIRMLDALLVAASIAIGAGLVLRLYAAFTGVMAI